MTSGGHHNNEWHGHALYSAPHVTTQLLGACQEGLFSPQALVKIALQDGPFCARLLSTAARACPDRLDPAAPLSSAVAGLNLSVIKSHAIQTARQLVDSSLTAEQAQFMRELWFYSQVGCSVAGCLAETISYERQEEAQLAGLLANIGMQELFARQPETYRSSVQQAVSTPDARSREQGRYGTDHLELADQLISAWGLESFLADAISLQHHSLDACRDASTLVRIVRLAQEFCQSPFDLSEDLLHAGEVLFSFDRKDMEYLFNLAAKQYRPLSPFEDYPQTSLEELNRVRKRLISAVFSLAEQEGIHTQLAISDGIDTLTSCARDHYLQNSPAREALLFLLDQTSSRLVGVPTAQQPRLAAELNPPMASGGLLAEALQQDKPCHSFAVERSELSVFDRQLIRLCKGQQIICLPLRQDSHLLGGVAFGIDDEDDLPLFSAPLMTLLNASVARALTTLGGKQAATAIPTRSDSDLIPKLAHEVSNPLTIINNYMGVIGPLLQGNESEDMLRAIEVEIKRIRDILKYYTEQKEAPQLAGAAVEVNELILSVVESLRPTFFHPQQIEIQTDFDSSIEPLQTKPVAIKQILINLLKNAAEALQSEGRIVLTTREHTTPEGQHFVVIRVEDNGPGIAEEIQRQLFSPVTSTKGGDHAGLGLNIVKGMVDDIGARISCYSSPQFGTSFELTIPRTEKD